MVRYGWADTVNRLMLQVAYTSATQIHVDNPSSFNGTETISDGNPECDVLVSGPGTITMDFGREYAAWLEFDAIGLNDADLTHVFLGISEYAFPAVVNQGPQCPNKTQVPIKYISLLLFLSRSLLCTFSKSTSRSLSYHDLSSNVYMI